MNEEKQLKIWHIPQVPGKAFEVNAKSIEEAKKILDILAAYDQFQFQYKIKPDFCNAQGVVVYDSEFDTKNNENVPLSEQNTGWIDWCCEENDECEGMDFDEYCEEKKIDFFVEIQKLNYIKF